MESFVLISPLKAQDRWKTQKNGEKLFHCRGKCQWQKAQMAHPDINKRNPHS